jgi:hypothetical protein
VEHGAYVGHNGCGRAAQLIDPCEHGIDSLLIQDQAFHGAASVEPWPIGAAPQPNARNRFFGAGSNSSDRNIGCTGYAMKGDRLLIQGDLGRSN